MMDISGILPTFVVTLREGFEAALVVGIVAACLQKAQATRLYRWLSLGVAGGIAASLAVGLFLWEVLQQVGTAGGQYAPVLKELLAGLFGLVAIGLLSWMLLWMTQQAKTVKGEVTGAIADLLQGEKAGRGIFLLVFVAVLREGFETVLFLAAKFDQDWTVGAIGAVLGLATAAGLGVLLFLGGIKIDIRRFFQVMGVFLLLIVGGLVLSALKHFEGAAALLSQLSPSLSAFCPGKGASCWLGPLVWNGAAVLSDRQFPGIILKALFGYRDRLFLGQVVAYGLFLSVMGTLYFRSLTGAASRPAPDPPQEAA